MCVVLTSSRVCGYMCVVRRDVAYFQIIVQFLVIQHRIMIIIDFLNLTNILKLVNLTLNKKKEMIFKSFFDTIKYKDVTIKIVVVLMMMMMMAVAAVICVHCLMFL